MRCCGLKRIIPLIVLLLCISIVIAQENETEEAPDYNVLVEIVKDSIYMDESAEFTFTIKNNLDEAEKFTLNTPEVEWSTNLPLEIDAEPLTETSSTVLITPLPKYITAGLYGVKVTVERENTGEVTEELLSIGVRGAEGGYTPTIKVTVDMATKVDPREPVTARVDLENLNTLDFPELILKVSGDLPEFEREQKITLEGLEKKVVEMTFNLDPATQPKGYRVFFELIQADQVIEKTDANKIEVIAFTPEFKREIEKSGILFKTINKITFSSDSNVRHTQTVTFPTNWFSRIFTSTTPDAYTLKDNGNTYLAWDLELGPDETQVVYVKTNYRIILYIVIIAIVILILYLKYKSPITIRKSISNVATKEGGISEMKVMLDISNKSQKEFRDINIVDIVPNIAEIEKDFEEGTIKPDKILKHRKKGSIMRWKLAEIAPGEERLISYHIKSKLSIIGSFKLPRAKMKFKYKKRTIITTSNSVGVSA